jgi:hypothetical protein
MRHILEPVHAGDAPGGHPTSDVDDMMRLAGTINGDVRALGI